MSYLNTLNLFGHLYNLIDDGAYLKGFLCWIKPSYDCGGGDNDNDVLVMVIGDGDGDHIYNSDLSAFTTQIWMCRWYIGNIKTYSTFGFCYNRNCSKNSV